MTCTNCNIELSDTAKFCPECGTRVPESDDIRIGNEIIKAYVLADLNNRIEEALATVRKARELLGVDALKADNARLKAELEAARTQPPAVDVEAIKAEARRGAF